MNYAYCWRGGEVEVGQTVPKGAMSIYRHRSLKKLTNVVEVLARHAYDGKTLLIPGVPEARKDSEKIMAIGRFVSEIEKRLIKVESDK